MKENKKLCNLEQLMAYKKREIERRLERTCLSSKPVSFVKEDSRPVKLNTEDCREGKINLEYNLVRQGTGNI